MPNRVLRDWTESEKMNDLSFQAEVFFTRLIMKVDDFGCYKANEVLLKSALFPLKDSIRNADILRWMAECQKTGLIVVYEVECKRFLQILDFGQRKRQMDSKYPLPNGSLMTVNCQTGDSLNRKEIEIEKNRIERTVFTPPSKEDVCNEMMKKLDDFTSMSESEKFCDFYESKGWFVGKSKMKSWQAAVRNWIRGINQFKNNQNGTTKKGTSESRIDAASNF